MRVNYQSNTINNVYVYGVAESMVRGGYPMNVSTAHFDEDVSELSGLIQEVISGTEGAMEQLSENKHYKRSTVLGKAKSGSGHDCMIKGINVHFDLNYTHVLTPQLQRYHFIDFISSQSKMHKVTKMNLHEACTEYTSRAVINEAVRLQKIHQYHVEQYGNNDERTKKAFWSLVDSLPMGLKLTGGMTTNYLQLKTMYNQRKNHKYHQWHDFCDFCDALPFFHELTGCERGGKREVSDK